MASLSVPVVYRTAKGTELEVMAVVGSTEYQVDDGGGSFVRTESRDFIIPASALALEPARGDSIIWRNVRYDVLSPDGSPCWRWSDAYHVMKRIHTKESGEDEHEC